MNVVIPSNVFAQSELVLPPVGIMIKPSIEFAPSIIKGIKVFPENPFKFEFIVDTGNTTFNDDEFKAESEKLIKYFMASLTVPEDDIWVNLSPYEKDRIIPDKFGTTEMGRDLLSQDYILKQLTSTLMYPEDELGQKFWDEVYKKAYEQFGVIEIPVNTFNKVWIVPEKAVVYTNKDMAFVIEAKLKVMLEEDYVAMTGGKEVKKSTSTTSESANNLHAPVASNIIRQIILPAIEKEVNQGKNFATLRQIYNSMILATWFKRNLKQSVLGKVYVGSNKVKGIELEDKNIKEKIYNQYLEAFKKGVYDYVKEDFDPVTQQIIPRKYFSGGMNWGEKNINKAMTVLERSAVNINSSVRENIIGKLKTIKAGVNPYKEQVQGAFKVIENDASVDPAMLGSIKNTLKVGMLCLMMGLITPKISDGISLNQVTYDTGTVRLEGTTEQGDTLQSIAKELIYLFYAVYPEEMPEGDIYWDSLVDHGYINEAGVFQPKFAEAYSQEYALSDAIKNEPSREKILKFLKDKFDKISNTNQKDIKGLMEEIQKRNHIHAEPTDEVAEGQVFNLDKGMNYIESLNFLKTSDVVSIQNVSINGKNIEVIYIDREEDFDWTDDYLAITINDKVFMNLKFFAKAALNDFKEKDAPIKKEVFTGWLRLEKEIFKEKSLFEIAEYKLKALWMHEVAGHGQTIPLIENGGIDFFEKPVEPFDQKALHEVSGLLGEIAGQPSSKAAFAKWAFLSTKWGSSLDTKYIYAAELLVPKMLEKLDFLKYAKQKRYKELLDNSERMDDLSRSKMKTMLTFLGENKDEKIETVIRDLQREGYLNEQEKPTKKYSPFLSPEGINLKGYSLEQKDELVKFLNEVFFWQLGYVEGEINAGVYDGADWKDWLDTLTDAQVEQAANDVHKEIFGVGFPKKDVINIPQEVKDSLRRELQIMSGEGDQAVSNTEKGMSPLETLANDFAMNTDEGVKTYEDVFRILSEDNPLLGPEWLIEDGWLNGKVYYSRGDGHGWDVYQSKDGISRVLDTAKGYYSPMNKYYMDSGLAETYQDVFKREVANNQGYLPYLKTKSIAKEPDVGGIDLNSNNINIEENGDGVDFDVPFDPAILDSMQVEGFTPVIIQIIPTNLPLLLGISKSNESDIQQISKS